MAYLLASMPSTDLALAALTLAAGTAAGAVDVTARQGRGLLKMTAASGYLAFALRLGALDTTYGRMVIGGLALSWVGDFLLLGDTRRAFLGGLASFLLAHVAYALAFSIYGVAGAATALGAAVMAVVGVAVMRWLLAAELPASMRVPVAAYLLAIGAMVALAAGTGRPIVAVGAAAFAASDVFVARHRFVRRSPVNRLLGLPLYFAAQLLIAASV